jgi:Mg2+ and Co2+ transporter CorA
VKIDRDKLPAIIKEEITALEEEIHMLHEQLGEKERQYLELRDQVIRFARLVERMK